MENIENVKSNKKQLMILIIAGVLIFLVGGGLGVASTQLGGQQLKNKAVNSLASKVVSSITTYGQVKSISGRNITLSNLGDNLTISIINNAQVYSFTTSSNSAPVQQIVKFENIKIGDSVNIVIKLLPTGQLEGSTVVILPPPAQNK